MAAPLEPPPDAAEEERRTGGILRFIGQSRIGRALIGAAGVIVAGLGAAPTAQAYYEGGGSWGYGGGYGQQQSTIGEIGDLIECNWLAGGVGLIVKENTDSLGKGVLAAGVARIAQDALFGECGPDGKRIRPEPTPTRVTWNQSAGQYQGGYAPAPTQTAHQHNNHFHMHEGGATNHHHGQNQWSQADQTQYRVAPTPAATRTTHVQPDIVSWSNTNGPSSGPSIAQLAKERFDYSSSNGQEWMTDTHTDHTYNITGMNRVEVTDLVHALLKTQLEARTTTWADWTPLERVEAPPPRPERTTAAATNATTEATGTTATTAETTDAETSPTPAEAGEWARDADHPEHYATNVETWGDGSNGEYYVFRARPDTGKEVRVARGALSELAPNQLNLIGLDDGTQEALVLDADMGARSLGSFDPRDPHADCEQTRDAACAVPMRDGSLLIMQQADGAWRGLHHFTAGAVERAAAEGTTLRAAAQAGEAELRMFVKQRADGAWYVADLAVAPPAADLSVAPDEPLSNAPAPDAGRITAPAPSASLVHQTR